MIGKTVSHYRIIAELGRGGMGVVYRARDTLLERDVALKFLPPHLLDDETSRERFLHEARAASALDHPNICTIYDIGEIEADRTTYIVMAYYDGVTLREKLRDGSLGVEEAGSIGAQVAAGLSAAHAAGIVHRDVKPANVVVTRDGVAKILDFGLAKFGHAADITRDGSTVGTAAYMSPEQAQGRVADARSDVWAFGVMLYEMLGGTRPFAGDYEQAVLYGIVHTDPTDIRELRPEVSDELADVLDRCLQKVPEDRWANAGAVRAALGAAGVVSTGVGSASIANGPVVNPVRIVAQFAASAVLVLSAAYAIMIALGLPGWVFPVATLLMLAGLPVVLLAGRAERRRRRGLVGFRGSAIVDRLLTMRRAVLGGVIALCALAVVAGSYMFMRTAGVGPFGTLVAKGTLDRLPLLVVSDFANSTPDETLGRAITQALRIDLAQSPAVRLMEPRAVAEAVRRMNIESGSTLTPAGAREVAVREGAAAVVAGEVAALGSGYSLTLSLQTPGNEEIMLLRETANGPDAVIDAVAKLSRRLRERVGESLKDLRASVPLARVTTSSLAALRLYTEAEDKFQTGDQEGSIPILEAAIERDSMFAMAYRRLSVALVNIGSDPEGARAAASKAYELRDRLPELERLLTEALYYWQVERDIDRRILAYETTLKRDSLNLIALNNLSLAYQSERRFKEAEALARRAVRNGTSITFFMNLMTSLGFQGDWAGIERTFLDMRDRDLEPLFVVTMEGNFETARGHFARAESLLVGAATAEGPQFYMKQVQNALRSARVVQGKLRAVGSNVDLISPREINDQTIFDYLDYESGLLDIDLILLGDKAAANARFDRVISRISFDGLAPEDRPYWFPMTWYAELDRTEEARAALDTYRRNVPQLVRDESEDEEAAEAFILLKEGRFDDAAALFDAVIADRGCYPCHWKRRGRALAYEAMGRPHDAINDYRFIVDTPSFFGIYDKSILLPLSLERLGDLYEQTSQYEKAVTSYERFAELWKDADPVLQPRVRNALSRIDAILTARALRE